MQSGCRPTRLAGQDRVPAEASGGRPPLEVRRYYASFSYRAQSWNKSRHVVAKVEWHPGELYPRVGFIVTNLARSAEGVVAFYNQRGTCEQYIKEGKNAIKWTRLSCRAFAANAVRLQLHALAYNLGNFMRTLAMPKTAEPWSLTSLREKLIKIGAKVVSHGRYVTFQLAEVAVPDRCSPNPVSDRGPTGTARARMTSAAGRMRQMTTAEVRPTRAEQYISARRRGQLAVLTTCRTRGTRFVVAQNARKDEHGLTTIRNPANVGANGQPHVKQRRESA